MGEINIESQPLLDESQDNAQILNNVKRLRSGDGSWRFERGALIITDETGTDRVLIGFGEGLF